MDSINNTSSDHFNDKALQEQHHVVTPINWKKLLQKQNGIETIFTPKSARIYIANVVRRMNSHFGIFMNGADISKLRITHKCCNSNDLQVDIVSISKAMQLFPIKLECNWLENGKRKKIFKNVIAVWLNSSTQRLELYDKPLVEVRKNVQSPVCRWLEAEVHRSDSELQIRFGGLTSRDLIYFTFLKHVNDNDVTWNAKRISSEIYKMIPQCRPRAGHRVRYKGQAMMYMPSIDFCCQLLKTWNQVDLQLIF